MKAVINWDYSNVDIKLQKILIEFIKKNYGRKKPTNIKKVGELIAPFIACIFIESNCDRDLSKGIKCILSKSLKFNDHYTTINTLEFNLNSIFIQKHGFA